MHRKYYIQGMAFEVMAFHRKRTNINPPRSSIIDITDAAVTDEDEVETVEAFKVEAEVVAEAEADIEDVEAIEDVADIADVAEDDDSEISDIMIRMQIDRIERLIAIGSQENEAETAQNVICRR